MVGLTGMNTVFVFETQTIFAILALTSLPHSAGLAKRNLPHKRDKMCLRLSLASSQQIQHASAALLNLRDSTLRCAACGMTVSRCCGGYGIIRMITKEHI